MAKKKNRLPPFVPILKDMIKSEAFKELTNAARVTYLLLKSQCCRMDQAEVKFPYEHATPYMNKHTFARAIDQLIEQGFIEKTQEGGFVRRTNIYKLVETWRQRKRT